MVMNLISTLLRRVLGANVRLLAVGSTAPAFEVLDQSSVVRKLADYRGRRLVLWFYPKASTPG